MKNKNNLNKYKYKLILEGILLSLIFGLLIGLGFSILLSLIFFVFKITGVFKIIIISGIIFLISTILLYFLKFKPTTNKIAKRVDNAGLKERVITMLELEGKDSVMIKLQRDDAKLKLEETKPKDVKFKSFKKQLITLAIIVVISITTLLFFSKEVDARYEASYEIIYDSNGGTLIENSYVKGGELIPIPKNPVKEGFDFIYWYEISSFIPYNFDKEVFEDKTLFALWEEKSNDYLIIEQLIKNLRNIVNNAKVSDELKDDLHLLIDKLEESIKRDDTLEAKLVKIEETRKEILDRIREEIESLLIIKIGDALKEFDSTYELGNAILTKKANDIDNAIDNLVENLLAIENREEQVEALLGTVDDIEEALELSNEENDRLRKTLQDLADYLRYLAREIEEGDIPEDVLENEFIEEAEDIKEELKDILDSSDDSNEEELENDIEDAFDEAMDELLGEEDDDNEGDEDDDSENEDEDESDEGEGNEEGENGNPDPEDKTPTIIDGNTKYTEMLQELIEELNDRLSDPNLTKEERDALNKYLNNINKELEENDENGN